MDKLIFIFVTALVVAVLMGLTQLSRQLGQGFIGQTRAWRISTNLTEVGRWMTIVAGVLIVPFVVIGLPLNAMYPAVYLPTLGKWLATMTVMGGFVLAGAALMVPGVLIWRVVLRFGARALIRRFQHAIQSKLTVHNSRKTLKFIGQLCFAVCAVALQFLSGLVLLLIKGVFEDNPGEFEDDGFLTEGSFYNYGTGKWEGSGDQAEYLYHSDD